MCLITLLANCKIDKYLPPTFFSHVTIVPCSMVGDKAGNFTSSCEGKSAPLDAYRAVVNPRRGFL